MPGQVVSVIRLGTLGRHGFQVSPQVAPDKLGLPRPPLAATSPAVPFLGPAAVALVLGWLIGAERQWRSRMAGLRTNALVALGAALFELLALLLAHSPTAGIDDPYTRAGLGPARAKPPLGSSTLARGAEIASL